MISPAKPAELSQRVLSTSDKLAYVNRMELDRTELPLIRIAEEVW